jgi:hypothetical protein
MSLSKLYNNAYDRALSSELEHIYHLSSEAT